jgi:hypothetical protein
MWSLQNWMDLLRTFKEMRSNSIMLQDLGQMRKLFVIGEWLGILQSIKSVRQNPI